MSLTYGVLWNLMESYGILWNLIESYGILWNLKYYVLEGDNIPSPALMRLHQVGACFPTC